jgi:DNA invertase Pin-like site-specific DNA recombinase
MSARLKLIGYRRVSTTGQVDRYGLPAQLTDLRGYVRSTGHRMPRYETDDAKSGTLPAAKRPALVTVLAAIEVGQVDGMLIPGDLDRLARELTVQEAILSQVWQAGGVVHTTLRGEIEPDDPDDPMRTAMRQVMGVFAQLERAMVAKRMRNGRKEKAAAGGYAGYGSPAFGLRSVEGDLVTDDREDAVKARMRELRDGGLSYHAIAAELNAAGLTSKRGGRWYAPTVSRVLDRVTA